ncbi:HNH endonuclease [Streptomyces sp. BH104]|uniref:HNH endonuclease n=1 Tax=Streptomyces sp. BH104 TaxID=3410407 RepID=UPI003BB49B8B
MHDRTCLVCGSSLAAKRSDAKYCSDRCRDRRKSLPPKPESVCVECGDTYVVARKDAIYCSTECRNATSYKRWIVAGGLTESRAERALRRSETNCSQCGTVFAARTLHTKYCSVKCKFAAGRAKQARVRAERVRAVGCERFTHEEIFNRDSWVCGLCGALVDEALSWPDPQSPSLDHIVPLSRAGIHARANVQLAHLVCNLRKNNRV